MNLTPEFSLASGESRTQTMPTLATGESTQLDWQLRFNGRALGDRLIGIAVDGAGTHSAVHRAVYAPTIPNVLYGTATDENGTPISGGTITVFVGDTVVGSALTQSDGRYVVLGLAPGDYRVRLASAGRADSYFTGSVHADQDSLGRSSNPSTFGAAANHSTFSYPNPVREGRAKISFYTTGSESGRIKIFDSKMRLVQELPAESAGAGWNNVDWPIDDVANGVYFYQLDLGGKAEVGKIAVLKKQRR
jgi:hypothetical protein